MIRNSVELYLLFVFLCLLVCGILNVDLRRVVLGCHGGLRVAAVLGGVLAVRCIVQDMDSSWLPTQLRSMCDWTG
jgi:hypothetical protein